MTPSSISSAANDQSVDSLIKTIRIPPRPSMLIDVQTELACKEPDPRRLAATIANDVALAASLLKLTNSSFFGLRLKASSVEHAVNLLGMRQCGLLMTGIIARQSVQVEKVSLVKFWDFSSKRAQAMSHLAGQMRICSADMAHTFGLFCDIGIPLLMERFPDYQQTLDIASQQFEHKFTETEQQRHSTSHTSIGALMARTWGLPEEVSTAILLHHDYEVLNDGATSETVRSLIALALVAEYSIHKYHGEETLAEWEKGGQLATDFLGLSHDELEDCFEELHEIFNHVH
ncbi:HDOD domain-containing protein [Undibacterium jejuense]|uniref:HDOD domain-containing protein n=1 Tax=Undibacterium jejuense TaxID=1344949 RepID=A0A923HKQ4_9BURK|nr:HDOD domain-containing protein [Undibacterium jejuense]MBC3864065.1 HDOD domain-containing protein [Undibacterium jejuense]